MCIFVDPSSGDKQSILLQTNKKLTILINKIPKKKD